MRRRVGSCRIGSKRLRACVVPYLSQPKKSFFVVRGLGRPDEHLVGELCHRRKFAEPPGRPPEIVPGLLVVPQQFLSFAFGAGPIGSLRSTGQPKRLVVASWTDVSTTAEL
ncbi:hypothetical protein [Streptomyces hypolithicus]